MIVELVFLLNYLAVSFRDTSDIQLLFWRSNKSSPQLSPITNTQQKLFRSPVVKFGLLSLRFGSFRSVLKMSLIMLNLLFGNTLWTRFEKVVLCWNQSYYRTVLNITCYLLYDLTKKHYFLECINNLPESKTQYFWNRLKHIKDILSYDNNNYSWNSVKLKLQNNLYLVVLLCFTDLGDL